MNINNILMKLLIIFSISSCPIISLASSEEISFGSAQAPVTLIEYGSLTCDYCIAFHREVLPRVKEHFIEDGTVRFVYRHFPTSEAAVQGAVAAQCAGDQSYEVLDALYSSVASWYKAKNRDAVFAERAASLGLNTEVFLSCLSDTKHLDEVVAQQQAARKEYGVTGTPTFVINGNVVRGKKSFAEIKRLINNAINKGS